MTEKPIVLIVEDSSPSAQLMVSLVELAGGEGRIVENGSAALKAVTEFVPALVVMDLRLPDGDGCDWASKIRSIAGENLPIWACTGRDAEELMNTAWDQMPFTGFIQKPFGVATVMEKLSAALSH